MSKYMNELLPKIADLGFLNPILWNIFRFQILFYGPTLGLILGENNGQECEATLQYVWL